MLRNLFCILVAGLWVTLLLPLVLTHMLVARSTDASMWWARRVWAPVLLWAGGAKLKIYGLENVDPKRPTVYASNHQSTIDIPTLLVALPVDFRFVAKHQLRWVPMIGWYLWIAGHILIDRSNRSTAVASLAAAGRRIRGGTSIVVYPEGTRSADRYVLPFKKGAFSLAVKAGVPICPVTIEGSGKLMPKNSWRITPGEIRVMIGAPIPTEGLTDRDREALLQKVRAKVVEQSLALGGLGAAPTSESRRPSHPPPESANATSSSAASP